MAAPTSARMTLIDWVVTQLETITGGDDFNLDLSGHEIRRALEPIDAIEADKLPWVAVFAGDSSGPMAMGGWYESEIVISVFLLMKASIERFPGETADELAEKLLADAKKAVLAAAKEPTTSGYIERFIVTPDVDEEMGRWSLKRLDLYWKLPQQTRGA